MMFLSKLFIAIVVAVSLSFAYSVPSVIAFQGRLFDTGAPVTATKNMRFEIVDNLGTAFWQSHASNSVEVYVNKGAYVVKLGDTSVVNMNPLNFSDIDKNVTLNLRVYVEGTQLTPDILFSATPYAFIARQAETITANTAAGNSLANALNKATVTVNISNDLTVGGLLTVNDEIDMLTVTETFTVNY